MPQPDHGECVVLRELHCRAPDCRRKFLICSHCYRGQRYCGPPCRARARAQQLRDANARHQRSEPGRLDHNQRQRTYRDHLRGGRAAKLVTYQSLNPPDSMSCCGHDATVPVPPSSVAPRAPRPASPRTAPPLRCSICRRPGVTLRFWLYCQLYVHSRFRTRGGP